MENTMETEKEIQELRGEIDDIDRKIICLLRKRFQVVEKIAGAKHSVGAAVEDAEREKDVLRNCKKEAGGSLDEAFIEKFTTLILEQSKKIQRR